MDELAFRQLFDSQWKYVYSYALRLTKSPEMAEDLAQEIFVRLWNNREKLAGVTNIQSFIYTVSRNLVYDHLRNRVFRDSNKEALDHYFSYTERTPLEALERKELSGKLQQAIDGLTPQLQTVFRLSYIEGLNHRQIAEKMHISPLSSRVFLVRAIAQLRKSLAGDGQ